MKKNLSATSNHIKVSSENQSSSLSGLIYKAKYTGNRSIKNVQYFKTSSQPEVGYWSNNTTLSPKSESDIVLHVNEVINVQLVSDKELESLTLYTSNGDALFILENVDGEKIALPKPLPGKYFIKAQFKCSKTIHPIDVQE